MRTRSVTIKPITRVNRGKNAATSKPVGAAAKTRGRTDQGENMSQNLQLLGTT